MKVDFDSLRRQLAAVTNNIIDQYNEQRNGVIDVWALHNKIDRLHGLVGTILALQSDGGDVFSDLDVELADLEEYEQP